MNKYIYTTVIIFMSMAVSLQAQKKTKVKTKEWSSAEKKFIGTAYTEDTVKNASTIIVASYFEYNVMRYGFGHIATYATHIQYKIKDRSALEANAEFAYDPNDRPELHIIKPSGEWKKVDFSLGLSSTKKLSIPGLTISAEGDYKIALSDLEIGDIIDFRYEGKATVLRYARLTPGNVILLIGTIPLMAFSTALVVPTVMHRMNIAPVTDMPEQRINLKSQYPILKRRIRIMTDDKVIFFNRSFNGAPEFEKKKPVKTKFIFDHNRTKTIIATPYEFNDSFQPAVKPEYFAYEQSAEPHVKFGFKTKIHEKRSFVYKNGSNPVSPEEIGKVASQMIYNKMYEYRGYNSKGTQRTFKRKNRQMARGTISEKINYLEEYYRYLNTNKRLSDFNTVVYMARLARKIKLPYQLIAAMPRDEGGKTELAITPNELSWGICVTDENNKSYYLTEFNKHATKNDIYSMLKGGDAILITPAQRAKNVKTEITTIPADAPKDNLYSIETSVSISKNLDTLICKNTYVVTGERKKYYYDDIQSEYSKLLEERKKAETKEPVISKYHYVKEMQESLEAETRRLTKVLEKSNDEYYENLFTKNLENDYPYSFVTFDSYNINKDGKRRKNESSDRISYSVNFRLGNYLNKVGNDDNMLSLDLGRLITTQTDIKGRDDRKRNYNIEVDEVKQFETNITLTIPDGYKPLNLENFNKNIDNEAGTFISKCTVSGNKLTFTTKKAYKALSLDKSKWPQMLQFLDAASEIQTMKLFLGK